MLNKINGNQILLQNCTMLCIEVASIQIDSGWKHQDKNSPFSMIEERGIK